MTPAMATETAGAGASRVSMDDPQGALSLEAALAFVDAYGDESESLTAAVADANATPMGLMSSYFDVQSSLFGGFDADVGLSESTDDALATSTVASPLPPTLDGDAQVLVSDRHSQSLVPAAPSSDDGKKTSKKRVRRQKEELVYLRSKVKEMEGRLSQLKRINTGAASKAKTTSSSSSTAIVAGKPQTKKGHSSALLASVWERLAQRQFQERERAEQENATLKATLEGQIKIAKTLEKLLKSRADADDVSDGAILLLNSEGETNSSVV